MNILYIRTLILQYLLAALLCMTILYMVGMFITFDNPSNWGKDMHIILRAFTLVFGLLGPVCMWSRNEDKFSLNKGSK